MLTREYDSLAVRPDQQTGGWMVVMRGFNTVGGMSAIVVANTESKDEAEAERDRIAAKEDA